jgi:hypothetical protein
LPVTFCCYGNTGVNLLFSIFIWEGEQKTRGNFSLSRRNDAGASERDGIHKTICTLFVYPHFIAILFLVQIIVWRFSHDCFIWKNNNGVWSALYGQGMRKLVHLQASDTSIWRPFITVMMKAVSISETSVNFYQAT